MKDEGLQIILNSLEPTSYLYAKLKKTFEEHAALKERLEETHNTIDAATDLMKPQVDEESEAYTMLIGELAPNETLLNSLKK